MVKQNLLFQAISLLSQYLTQIKEAKGPFYQKTACLNAEEREMIGTLEAVQVFLDPNEDKELIEMLKKIEDYLETVGISRWPRTELTDLGLRVGQKHMKVIDLAKDTVTEVDLMPNLEETSEN